MKLFVILHEGHALTLDGIGDNNFGFAVVRLCKSVNQRPHIVSVTDNGFPVASTPEGFEIHAHDIFSVSIRL